eukprot:GDKH01027456.1.p1 GENE.GDKH01027456.1~~GDKH01027456.1.p1  ORF type:complete len:85 (-),score=10.17 GDKH01027456.1:294-548(-)
MTQAQRTDGTRATISTTGDAALYTAAVLAARSAIAAISDYRPSPVAISAAGDIADGPTTQRQPRGTGLTPRAYKGATGRYSGTG